MNTNETIERLIVDASSNPLDPVNNFVIAQEYERLNQTASAVGFYLRAAEYGYDSEPDIVYSSLLRISICIEGQKDRNWTVSNVLLQAIAYIPSRPEAYFLMSRFYERSGHWQESYTFAQMGLMHASRPHSTLPVDVEYVGANGLNFQKAVAAWWVGRKNESIEIFLSLLGKSDLPEMYRASVRTNLERMGVTL